MTQRPFFRTTENRDRRPRWLSSPVSTTVGNLPYVYQSVPVTKSSRFKFQISKKAMPGASNWRAGRPPSGSFHYFERAYGS